MKRCSKCQELKVENEFYKTTSKSGLTSSCKRCRCAYAAVYLSENRKAVMKVKSAYRLAHPRNPITNRARRKRYKQNHPEQIRAEKAIRRSRERGAFGRYSGKDVKRLFERQLGKCPGCRGNLALGYHIDHVIPLASGGSNLASNIQLLCPTCNIRKGAKNPVDFMRERGLLL